MSSPTSAPTTTQSKNDARAYSAGCVRDGRALCACDIPAARYISRTDRNPDRAFYRCANKKCSFWKWESDLLAAGLIPPQPAVAPETPQRQHNLLTFATPRANNLPTPETPQRQQKPPSSTNTIATPRGNLPLSPPQTQSPAKRSYARMSTGSHVQSGARPSDLSEEARARRHALIMAALAGTDVTDHDGSAAPADGSNSDSGEDIVRGDYYRESESSDEEYPTPMNKRLRFALKTEEEEEEKPLVSQNMQHTPPRRSSPLTVSLPTPSHTSERGSTAEVDNSFGATPPASPTLSTKGARRALERAHERASTAGSSSLATKAGSHALGDGVTTEVARTEDASYEPVPVPGPPDNAADDSREGVTVPEPKSFQAQLASTIEKSGSNMSTLTSSYHGSYQTRSSAATALSALSTMTTHQATLQTALHDLIAESERLRRKLVAAEKSVVCKQECITKLQEEIARLETRNAVLQDFQDQMRRITQLAPARGP